MSGLYSINEILGILKDGLADTRTSERAAAALKYYAEKMKEAEGKSESDINVVRMLLTIDLSALWSWPDQCFIEETTKDGVTSRRVSRREEKVEALTLPYIAEIKPEKTEARINSEAAELQRQRELKNERRGFSL